jgi:predicted DNA-binding protein
MFLYCLDMPTSVLSIRLSPELERRLSELAKRTGRSKSGWARELIETNIDDLEKRNRAGKRRAPLASRQVRK